MKRKILLLTSIILIIVTTLSCLCYAAGTTTSPDSTNFPKAEDFPDDGPTSILIIDGDNQKKRDLSVETTQYYIDSFEAEIDLDKDDGITVMYEVLEDGTTRQIDKQTYHRLNNDKSARAEVITFHLGFRSNHEVYYEVKSNVSNLVGVRGYAFVKNTDVLHSIFYYSDNFLYTGGYPLPYGTNIMGYATCPGNNSIVRVGYTNVLIETIEGLKSMANSAGLVTHTHFA